MLVDERIFDLPPVVDPVDTPAPPTPRTPRTTTTTTRTKGKKAEQRGEKASRFDAINYVADSRLAELTPAEVAVWLLLFRDTSGKTGTARTAQSYLAARAGCKVLAVKRAIKGLERKRLLTVLHRGGRNRGLSVYRLNSG
jgi:hypothetical protein